MISVEEEADRLLLLPDLTEDERRYIIKWRDGEIRVLFFRCTVSSTDGAHTNWRISDTEHQWPTPTDPQNG